MAEAVIVLVVAFLVRRTLEEPEVPPCSGPRTGNLVKLPVAEMFRTHPKQFFHRHPAVDGATVRQLGSTASILHLRRGRSAVMTFIPCTTRAPTPTISNSASADYSQRAAC